MKIETTQPLIGYDGKPLQNGSDGPLTLRSVCCAALTATYQDEPNLSGEEKVRRFELARLLYREEQLDMTIEDVALLRVLVAKGYGPIVVGPAWEALDL